MGLTLTNASPVHSAGDTDLSALPSIGDLRPTMNHELLGMEVVGPTGVVSAVPRAVGSPTSVAPQSSSLHVVDYTVKPGDTVWDIAIAHGTDEDSILALNEIRPSTIQIGMKLKVPTFKGAVYKVQGGDTLSEIAAAFGLTTEEVMKQNQIANAASLQVGQTLMLPGAAVQASSRNQVASRGTVRSARWAWPLWNGQVTSEFGPRWGAHHNGIDIAAGTGTPVGASRPGTVTFAGWDGGYGYAVVINHGDGTESRYAHASSITVNVGDWVNTGEMVIRVGSTGNSTGPHLHFEILVNGVQKNPRAYLP